MTTGSGGTGAVGDFMSLTGSNHEGDSIFTLGGSPSGKSLTLDFGSNFAGHKIKILATINRSVVEEKTKSLVTGYTRNQTSLADINKQGGMRLSVADVYKLNSVKMATGFGTYSSSGEIDITDRFTLDNGQRDNFYDIGRVFLKTGAVVPTGSIQINVDYFSHGSGAVSYTHLRAHET